MRKLTERDTLPRLRKGEAFRELVQGLGRYPEALQFENDKALTTAIDKAAASAAAFPGSRDLLPHSCRPRQATWNDPPPT